MSFPDPQTAARMRATATSLCQSLARELAHLETGRRAEDFQEIYDNIYLPRLTALALQAEYFLEFEEWALFRQPLHPDLAATQVRIIGELLWVLAEVI